MPVMMTMRSALLLARETLTLTLHPDSSRETLTLILHPDSSRESLTLHLDSSRETLTITLRPDSSRESLTLTLHPDSSRETLTLHPYSLIDFGSVYIIYLLAYLLTKLLTEFTDKQLCYMSGLHKSAADSPPSPLATDGVLDNSDISPQHGTIDISFQSSSSSSYVNGHQQMMFDAAHLRVPTSSKIHLCSRFLLTDD